jgi:hypothetical protein
MAKRFTESTKWKKLWIRKLDPKYKLFWFYLLDNCDHAGIYDADIESASFHIGIEYDAKSVLKVFNRKIIAFKKDKWFIPKFVEYQYGELNENNRAHLSVINILNRYNLLNDPKGLTSPLVGDKSKDKSKVESKSKSKSKSDQLLGLESDLDALQVQFPDVYVKIEFDKFVDYIDSKGKTYKNYKSGFRNWLRNDSFGQMKREVSKSKRSEVKEIDSVCTECDYSFKHSSGVLDKKCPNCNEYGIMDRISYNLIRGING